MSRIKDVELDVARLLEAAELGSLADGLPTLYAGPYPESVPDAFLACRRSGGAPPDSYLAASSVALHEETVTVLVRGDRAPGGYIASRACAITAWETLFEARPEGYVSVSAEDAGPTWLGEDDEGRPQWSFTVALRYSSR